MGKIDFENLSVWEKAMDVAEKCITISEIITQNNAHYRIASQLESAALSVPQNIAEGKGRHSQKEFLHFLYIARGSLYETLTILIMLERKTWISSNEIENLRREIETVAKMINALITKIKIDLRNK